MRRTLIGALLLLLACGGGSEPQVVTDTVAPAATPTPATPPPPAEAEAATLVGTSAEFSEYQFTNAAYSLPMQQSAMTEPGRAIARDLRKAGWISIDGAGTVVLTPKAQGDKRFLVRQNGFVDIVPLARKEVIAADLVSAGESGQQVADFRWKWVPNEIGRVFVERYSGEQHARATLMWDGSQWTVVRIEPRTAS